MNTYEPSCSRVSWILMKLMPFLVVTTYGEKNILYVLRNKWNQTNKQTIKNQHANIEELYGVCIWNKWKMYAYFDWSQFTIEEGKNKKCNGWTYGG